MANSPARSVDVGSVIAGTYTIEALIGRGGMGSVYLASHIRLPGKQVAIKLLHAELCDDDALARFKREAQIATQLGHPNIVEVHDFNVTADGMPYLVLEYLEGEALSQRLHRQGALAIEQVLSIVRQVGSALAAAHRAGIVHRDLKPANIFLIPTEIDGELVEIAKILDFGISKMLGSSSVKTQDFTLLGTPAYMAPEQAKGEHGNVDQRTDLFAFGSIVYEMLAGHPPFAGASIPEVVFKVVYEPPLPLARQAPNAPPAMVAAVERAMSKAAADRFPSSAAFVEALTGKALISISKPASIPPSDRGPPSRTPITGQEAFAQTSLSPSLPVQSRPANIETVASNAQLVAVHDEVVPPRRGRAVVIAAVLAGIAIAAVVAYFVSRSPAGEPARPDAAIALATTDAVPPPPPDAAVDAVVLAVAIDAPAVVVDAAIARAPTDARPARTPPASGPEGAAEAALLVQAQGELNAKQYGAAERSANAVIRAAGNGPNAAQLARAHLIHGAVQCLEYRDLGRARIDFDHIPAGFAQLRAQLRRYCADVGSL